MRKLWQELISVVRGGLLHIFSGNILTKAIAMISSIVIARIVDKSEYAYYTYANNLYSYVDVLAGLGLASAMLKYCSVTGERAHNKAYFLLSLRNGGLFQLVTAAVLCFSVFFIDIPFPEAKKYIYFLICMPSLTYALTTVQNYSRTQLRYKVYSGLGVLQAAIVCVIGIILVWLLNVWGMIVARYIAVLSTVSIGFFCLRDLLRGVEPISLNHEEKKGFYSMGISLLVANAFSALMPINEAFLVNNLIRDEAITANFKVAGFFPEQLLIVTGSMMVYYFPIAARISDPKEFWQKTKKIGLINAAVVIPVVIVGMLLTPFFIQLLYGQKYMDAIPLTYMLWFMRSANALIRIVPMNLLPALGCVKFNAISAIVSCAIQTALDYILILNMGIQGVAYATLIVYLVFGIITWGYLYYVCKERQKEGIQTNES